MIVHEDNRKFLQRAWTLLFVLLLILLMTVPAKADIEPKYYGGMAIPFYLYKKSQVKIYLHSSDGSKKMLAGTFILGEGHQKMRTLKNGIYSVKISSPPEVVVKQNQISREAMAELRLSALLREVKSNQAVVSQ